MACGVDYIILRGKKILFLKAAVNEHLNLNEQKCIRFGERYRGWIDF